MVLLKMSLVVKLSFGYCKQRLSTFAFVTFFSSLGIRSWVCLLNKGHIGRWLLLENACCTGLGIWIEILWNHIKTKQRCGPHPGVSKRERNPWKSLAGYPGPTHELDSLGDWLKTKGRVNIPTYSCDLHMDTHTHVHVYPHV